MTDPEFDKDLVKDLKYLESLIIKLEERIIALEMTRVVASERAVHIHGEDAYYWEHG